MVHMLDSDQLRTFVAIADTGSFTRAADLVHKTQSAVSMQMRRLEERVGRPLFEKVGRTTRLTEDGERVLDYARRIVRLSVECMTAFSESDLAGRVRLGLPDDYADRYLPDILAAFARSNPRAEVTVICEPTPILIERMDEGEIDLAIITHVEQHGPAEIIRIEQLLWVASARHAIFEERPLPLALGRSSCCWRRSAAEALEGAGTPFRIAYVTPHSTAVGAAVIAGLAVSILPESAIRAGMRILGARDGFPDLPSCKIALLQNRRVQNRIADALANEIRLNLDNLGGEALVAAE